MSNTDERQDNGMIYWTSTGYIGQYQSYSEEVQDYHTRALSFWNSRAKLGNTAGTQDLIAHQLEVEAIAKYVKDGMRVLDVGCGTGETGGYLLDRYKLDWWGIDFAENMIAAARARLKNKRVWLEQNNVLDFSSGMLDNEGKPDLVYTRFDLIYSVRCLINLPSWEQQEKAIRNILGLLKPGGLYVMLENSQEGLDEINELREKVGLPLINRPWHNRYIHDDDIYGLAHDLEEQDCKLEAIHDFRGEYDFLSRIVNAYLAAQEGKEPEYNSPINQLALKLQGTRVGVGGQGKIWLWRKHELVLGA